MIKEAKNKGDITAKEEKIVSEQSYFFPDYQKTIVASSLEEAEKKLQAEISAK